MLIEISSLLDIDECLTANHGCTQTCDNTVGSYECCCLDGYELDSDNYTCIGKITISVYAYDDVYCVHLKLQLYSKLLYCVFKWDI